MAASFGLHAILAGLLLAPLAAGMTAGTGGSRGGGIVIAVEWVAGPPAGDGDAAIEPTVPTSHSDASLAAAPDPLPATTGLEAAPPWPDPPMPLAVPAPQPAPLPVLLDPPRPPGPTPAVPELRAPDAMPVARPAPEPDPPALTLDSPRPREDADLPDAHPPPPPEPATAVPASAALPQPPRPAPRPPVPRAPVPVRADRPAPVRPAAAPVARFSSSAAIPSAAVAPRSGNGDGISGDGISGDGISAAGNGPPGRDAALDDYLARLMAWLEQHRRYPDEARRRRAEGVALVTVVIDRQGNILSHAFARRSGHAALDRAVEDMIRRAAPVPPLPDALGMSRLTIAVPVRFRLH